MPRPSRQHEGRLEILEAAARFIAHHGFHGMSMRDLARATGKSLAGFYNYYRSKEDVLFELQLRAFETLVHSAEAAIAAAENPLARFYAFILQHLQYVASHPDVMHVLVEEAGALPAQRHRVIRAAKERYFAIGQRLMGEVIQSSGSGVRRRRPAVSSTELERITYAVFGMLNWTYGWYRPDRHGSPEELARTIYRISLRGLGADQSGDTGIASVEARLTARQLPPLLELVERRVAP
jgi:TetR/AcrR family transcriptional regulator, cholesterol catabolism regulator